MQNRIPRLNALIKKEVNQILLRELDLPPDVLLTITRVETFSNLSEAKIYISFLPEDQENSVFKILNKSIYDIQQELNRRLRMRPVPKIRFEREEMTKEAGRIDDLLEGLKKEEK